MSLIAKFTNFDAAFGAASRLGVLDSVVAVVTVETVLTAVVVATLTSWTEALASDADWDCVNGCDMVVETDFGILVVVGIGVSWWAEHKRNKA